MVILSLSMMPYEGGVGVVCIRYDTTAGLRFRSVITNVHFGCIRERFGPFRMGYLIRIRYPIRIDCLIRIGHLFGVQRICPYVVGRTRALVRISDIKFAHLTIVTFVRFTFKIRDVECFVVQMEHHCCQDCLQFLSFWRVLGVRISFTRRWT